MCFFPEIYWTRPVDTVKFPPSKVIIPQITIDDFLHQAASNIFAILQDPPSTIVLQLKVGCETRYGFQKLASPIKITTKLPKLPSTFNTNIEVVNKQKFWKFVHQYIEQQGKKTILHNQMMFHLRGCRILATNLQNLRGWNPRENLVIIYEGMVSYRYLKQVTTLKKALIIHHLSEVGQ